MTRLHSYPSSLAKLSLLLVSAVLLLSSSPGTALAAAGADYRIVNDSGAELGIFGGVTTTLNKRGEIINALTLITDSGYMVPLSDTGEIGLAGRTFFTEAGCSGDEYLPATGTKPNPPPLTGTVYRSPASGQLRYIPQYTRAERVTVGSKMYFEDGKLNCSPASTKQQLLPTLPHDPDVTAYEHRGSGSPLALRAVSTGSGAGLLNRLSGEGNSPPEPLPLAQQECSPGCTWGDTGNKVCDIACYVDACGYDEGDCDGESTEFMQTELAKFCSPGCTTEDLGDGFCDTACNTSACEFDRGDCAIE